ncbi:MAG: cell wall anchor protein [Paludibacteraceae bacterium]|nr:cell wall anchor protein [Paludibacteraceae bacterium]
MNILSIILTIVVSAQLDSTQLMIGDQCDLRLQATLDKQEHVQFPVYGEELIPGIEITDRTMIDTVSLKDGRQQLTQYLTVTSFKDSLFFIPALPFVSGDDTMFTDPLSLNVIQPFEIDTTQNAITDIKPVYKAPIWWWGILRWVLLALAIAGLGVGAYYLYKYIQKRRLMREGDYVEPEVIRPAEEVALEKLDKIKEEKIWQQGRQKDYHTELTDVVREYIANRFGISSQEQTSSEILTDIQPVLKDRKDLYSSLKKMLSLADLVKFAKWNPLPDENEQSLRSAYEFVRETTPEEETVKNEE